MLTLAILIGIYSYTLFAIGIFGLLNTKLIILASCLFLLLTLYVFRNIKFKLPKLDLFSKFLVFLLFLQAAINLIGVLGPEISFDSLWYHLTIPKLFLEAGRIYNIPGNLLYYSVTPKAIDLIHLLPLSIGSEIGAKLIHYIFGLLCVVITYKLSRKFLSQQNSLLSTLVFYSSLVIGWETITAYIDLGWAFFELCSLYQFINWLEMKSLKNLLLLGILVGLSITTKITALNSIVIFSILITIAQLNLSKKLLPMLSNLITFIFVSIITVLPWFAFAILTTGNPIYPLFSTQLVIHSNISLNNIFNLFLNGADPINPIYVIVLPLIFFVYKRFKLNERIILLYSLISLVLWFFIGEIGGSRFMIPYLPALSVLTLIIIGYLKDNKIQKAAIIFIILFSVISIGYRGVANAKFLPVILGRETKQQFLINNLNFHFGDFVDSDNYFKTHLKDTDKVLLYGFHNLYYVDFPYIDSSWVKKGDRFNYIATQNTILPKRFSDWKLVYNNAKTNVKLYTKGGMVWEY